MHAPIPLQNIDKAGQKRMQALRLRIRIQAKKIWTANESWDYHTAAVWCVSGDISNAEKTRNKYQQ